MKKLIIASIMTVIGTIFLGLIVDELAIPWIKNVIGIDEVSERSENGQTEYIATLADIKKKVDEISTSEQENENLILQLAQLKGDINKETTQSKNNDELNQLQQQIEGLQKELESKNKQSNENDIPDTKSNNSDDQTEAEIKSNPEVEAEVKPKTDTEVTDFLMNYGDKPKIQLNFDGCYKYGRLKKEGFVE